MKPPILQHRPYVGDPWPVAWCDPETGELLLDGRADPIRLDPLVYQSSPLRLLDYLELDMRASGRRQYVVYLKTGETVASCPDRPWYVEPALADWEVVYRSGSPSRRSAVYHRDGIRIDLRHTPAWFGGDHPLQRMRMAYGSLKATLEREFGRDGDHVTMRGTPSQTALALLDISLPKTRKGEPIQYQPLSKPVRELLQSITFQHRHELYRGADSLSRGFTVWDARLAYAAYLRDNPTGEPEFVRRPEFVEYLPAWYHVRIAISPSWQHIGLAMRISDRTWPRHGWFETWISEPELRVLRGRAGWSYEIIEGILWRNRAPDPLRTWGDRLVNMYLRAAALPDPDVSRMLRDAVKRIIHGGIGALGRTEGYDSAVIPFGQAVNPAWIESVGPFGYECRIPRPLTNERARYCFPQIPAQIYAKQRASLARFTLGAAQPYELVGVHTDAIMLARYEGYKPRPEADIGAYRIVGTLAGPQPAPQSWEQLGALVRAARRTYGQLSEALYDDPGARGNEIGE
jgi:hypothetical protein